MKRIRTKGHTLTAICKFIGISPQAYYKRLSKVETKNNLYNKLENIVIELLQMINYYKEFAKVR